MTSPKGVIFTLEPAFPNSSRYVSFAELTRLDRLVKKLSVVLHHYHIGTSHCPILRYLQEKLTTARFAHPAVDRLTSFSWICTIISHTILFSPSCLLNFSYFKCKVHRHRSRKSIYLLNVASLSTYTHLSIFFPYVSKKPSTKVAQIPLSAFYLLVLLPKWQHSI